MFSYFYNNTYYNSTCELIIENFVLTYYLPEGSLLVMDMKEKILNSAQRLIQQSGANAFSYADVASEVGIRKASLHYHYATKMDLIKALIERYSQQAETFFVLVDNESKTADEKLKSYFDLYKNTLDMNKVCLGGMLSAESLSLDDKVAPLLMKFFNGHVTWLTSILHDGEREGVFILRDSPKAYAGMIISTLQGALMVSRGLQEKTFFSQSINNLLLLIMTKE